MKHSTLSIGLASAAVLLIASAASAAPPSVFFKAGAGADRTFADEQACHDKGGYEGISATPVPGGPMGGAGLMEALAESDAQKLVTVRCMRSLGYGRLPITEPEATDLKSRKGDDAKRAWLTAFLAGDLTARIAAASQTSVPQLPSLPPVPFDLNGVVLDPASLTLTGDTVDQEGVVMTGKASHRRTGVAKADFANSGLMHYSFAKGAIFHQIPNPDPDLAASTLWCGPGTSYGAVAHHNGQICFGAYVDGYRFRVPGSWAPWLAGAPTLAPLLIGKPSTDAPQVEVSADDLIGPMDVEFRVSEVDKNAALLAGFAVRDGKKVLFWRERFLFDDQGRIVVPLWSKTLTLTRASKYGLRLSFAEGDGHGPYGA